VTFRLYHLRDRTAVTISPNPAKAKEKLGWTPKITFDELVSEMVKQDLKDAKRDDLCRNNGYSVFDHNE